jgi:magnesium transporter
MISFIKKGIAGSKLGKPPGTILSFSGSPEKEVEFEHIRYNSVDFRQKMLKGSENVPAPDDSDDITWLCFFGQSDLELMNRAAELYDIPHLLLEDILNPDHRPKIEIFDNQILIIVKMISINDEGSLVAEQVSFVVGKNYVLAFQEFPGDLFDPVRERLKKSLGRIRSMTADYLAFALLDLIVDNYFVVLEAVAEVLEGLEMTLIKEPSEFDVVDIHDLKMQLFYLRKIAWPLREVANGLQKAEIEIIRPHTKMYFTDVYDHSIRVLETTETLREVAIGVSELYMSNISLKMNEIMQTLTIISTIFIPTTFVAGIYGMNFEFMPELKWQWGYFGALGFMLMIGLVMLAFFRRKRWI